MNATEAEIIGLSNKADAVRKQGDKTLARNLFARALGLLRQHGATPQTATALLSNFGIFMHSEGELKAAVAAQRQALSLDLEHGQPADQAFSRHNLGMALVESGTVAEGLQNLQAARVLREDLADFDELIFTYELLITTYRKEKNIDEAREVFEAARKIEPGLRNGWSMRGVVMEMARAEADDGNWEAARKLAIEAVSCIESRRAANTHIPLDQYDSRYNRHYLSAIELFLAAGEYDATLNLVDRTRFRSGCDHLDAPRIMGDRDQLGPLALPRMRAGELVLVDWVYPKHTWSFALTDTTREIRADRVVTSTRKGDRLKHDLKTEWAGHAQVLLSQVQPVLDFHETAIRGVDEIVIIPHGTGWQAPFAAALGPDGDFLSRTHRVLLSPSLRYCRIADAMARVEGAPSLVVGDPGGDLAGARSEARNVADLLGAQLLEGSQATRANVLDRFRSGPLDVVHFACHGTPGDGGLGGVMLADGLLSADDLKAISLRANIVNLVACWSGLTQFSVWNELDGFIRALLTQGVRNVVASVYPVSDGAGRGFSETYYDAHAGGAAPSEAARRALCAISADHPVGAWCGLFVTGARSPVSS